MQVCLRGSKPGKAATGPRRQDREIRKLRGDLQRESDKFSNMVAKYQRELLDVSNVRFIDDSSSYPLCLSSNRDLLCQQTSGWYL